MKNYILEKILLPIADAVTKQQVMDAYNYYKEAQWYSTDHLLKIQEEKLQKTIAVAFEEVPFYRKLLEGNNLKPKDISNLEDIAKIPIVKKQDLRNAYPEECVRRHRRGYKEFFTSGSSGQPFAVMLDGYTLSHARALMFLRANFSGWEIGQPMLQTGMSLKRGVIKRAKDIILNVKYVSAFDLTDKVLDRYLEYIENYNLQYVMGYPGSIYFLAKRARENGFNFRLRGVVCWGDNLYAHYRHEIENVFKCNVTDTYGCGEGIQVASQCSEGRYHVFMPHVLVEIVDDYGNVTDNGETGSILLTRLNPGAMPIIRYQVGDRGRMHKLSQCKCGRGLVSIDAIEGRDTDVVITPRGNRLIVHFFTGIFEYFPSIDTFKIIQERPGIIHVKIVPRENFEINHWELIKAEILEKGDPDLEIEMELVEEISVEPSNKRRFVVSKLTV